MITVPISRPTPEQSLQRKNSFLELALLAWKHDPVVTEIHLDALGMQEMVVDFKLDDAIERRRAEGESSGLPSR